MMPPPLLDLVVDLVVMTPVLPDIVCPASLVPTTMTLPPGPPPD